MKDKFERIVKFGMPFDKRTSNPNTNYGIGSMGIWFILKGKKGAVQVFIATNHYLSETILEYQKDNKNLHYSKVFNKPEPTFRCWDVGFHSKKKPKYMEKSQQQKCNIIGKCYYDGSSLRGDKDKVAEKFLEGGEETIWKYLEKYYNKEFQK